MANNVFHNDVKTDKELEEMCLSSYNFEKNNV